MIIKPTKVRLYLKSKGKRMSRGVMLALDIKVRAWLDRAASNAGPFKTVRADDVEGLSR